MKWHGLLGLAIIALGQVLLYAGVDIVATWFTPIMWTGYILLVDAWIARRSGASWLTTRRWEFPFLAVLSVLTWVMFEVYNFKLKNWAYVGLPEPMWHRDLGFFWAFATITPAIFLTADLLAAWQRRALWVDGETDTPVDERAHLKPAWLAVMALAGLALVLIPPALPDHLAPYTFAAVWVGFIFLLEPINFRARKPSLLREWLAGRRGVIWRWLAAGFICGLLWEVWNVQALSFGGGGWHYALPPEIDDLIFGLHYGQMPLAGMLGFPPFALECFALYYFLRWALHIDCVLPPWRNRRTPQS